MATATYLASAGAHELSVSLPDYGMDGPVIGRDPAGRPRLRRVECVALPPGVPRLVSMWAAVWLAGARRRYGPWVRVRFERGEWARLRQRAPWIIKATDALVLLEPGLVDRFHQSETLGYETLNDGTRL